MQQENRSKFTAIFNFLGGVSGLLALAVLGVRGGELTRQVEINTIDIKELKQGGSAVVQAHIASDKKEFDITSDRLSNISRLVEKQVEMGTALISQNSRLIDIIKLQQGIK